MIRGNLLLKLGLGAVLGLISYALFSMTTTTKNDGENVRQNKILRSSSSPPPVKVQVYTEALCNGCQMFMLASLIPAYRKLAGDDGKNDVMDLTWIPFGNSDLDEANHSISCQHGDAECDADIWEQCAAYMYRDDPAIYLTFVECLEEALPMGHRDELFPVDVFEDCANIVEEMNFEAISACHDNPFLSWTLQVQAARATPDDHKYVPWVVINGDLYDQDEDEDQDFLATICSTYQAQGGSHPACSQ